MIAASSVSVKPNETKIKENKETKVKKKNKKISAWFLALCSENCGSGKKKCFSYIKKSV